MEKLEAIEDWFKLQKKYVDPQSKLHAFLLRSRSSLMLCTCYIVKTASMMSTPISIFHVTIRVKIFDKNNNITKCRERQGIINEIKKYPTNKKIIHKVVVVL